MKRTKFSKEFKAKVALEAIKGQRTVNEIASEFEVHPSQVNTWKKQAMDGLGETFERKGKTKEEVSERERDRLYQKVGQLQIELDRLAVARLFLRPAANYSLTQAAG